jgi:hypothetical protein
MRFFNVVYHPLRVVLAIASLIIGFPLVDERQPDYKRQYITITGKKMRFTSVGLANRRHMPSYSKDAGWSITDLLLHDRLRLSYKFLIDFEFYLRSYQP